ncbi:MAG: hypothetical protein STHCBS139747_005084 [Sporothrix thermara]
MDLAYDHIVQDSFPRDEEGRDHSNDAVVSSQATLNSDIQAAYSAISATASPWASRIGGFFGNVVKQGESVYREAQQEVTALSQDATKGLSGLRNTIVSHTRNLSMGTVGPSTTANPHGSAPSNTSDTTATTSAATAAKDGEKTPTKAEGSSSSSAAAAASTSAGDDEDTVLARIKEEAAKRLRDLQRAEDAADEALIKFGTGLRDFLRDAITIAPPSATATAGAPGSSAAAASGAGGSTVLFESKDAQGKRVIHTSRFDAQLHVIHTSPDSFAKDPASSDEFVAWSGSFDIDQKTADIASDLNKYPELRTTMEKLVPATVPYADFWKRYYFLRHGIETAEARRRDLLKAASAEEEIAWDEDSDEDDDDDEEDEEDSDDDDDDASTDGESKATAGKAPAAAKTTPLAKAPTTSAAAATKRPVSAESTATIQPAKAATATTATTATTTATTASTARPAAKKTASTTSVDGMLKPGASPRKSDEKSVADSEASYDMVGAKSGVTSQAPNSPQPVDEDSEEEDWE